MPRKPVRDESGPRTLQALRAVFGPAIVFDTAENALWFSRHEKRPDFNKDSAWKLHYDHDEHDAPLSWLSIDLPPGGYDELMEDLKEILRLPLEKQPTDQPRLKRGQLRPYANYISVKFLEDCAARGIKADEKAVAALRDKYLGIEKAWRARGLKLLQKAYPVLVGKDFGHKEYPYLSLDNIKTDFFDRGINISGPNQGMHGGRYLMWIRFSNPYLDDRGPDWKKLEQFKKRAKELKIDHLIEYMDQNDYSGRGNGIECVCLGITGSSIDELEKKVAALGKKRDALHTFMHEILVAGSGRYLLHEFQHPPEFYAEMERFDDARPESDKMSSAELEANFKARTAKTKEMEARPEIAVWMATVKELTKKKKLSGADVFAALREPPKGREEIYGRIAAALVAEWPMLAGELKAPKHPAALPVAGTQAKSTPQ